MRDIAKEPEPRSLTEHRAGEHCDYDNYQGKDELRQTLVREQRGLCCYCMGRIRADRDSMKIEHWKCLDRFPGDQLNYQNLLGACFGGEGQPSNKQHCDTQKGSRDLRWNPADPEHPIEPLGDYDGGCGGHRADRLVLIELGYHTQYGLWYKSDPATRLPNDCSQA